MAPIKGLFLRLAQSSSQLGHLLIYALWVGCSFAFIAFVSPQDAALFLSVYASGSLFASLFAIPIYTSWRRRWFDLLFVSICLVATAIAATGPMLPLYWTAAFALNIVDFSIAQTGRPKAVIIMRITVSLSALLIIIDFNLALISRLLICASAIIWSTYHKQYDVRALPGFDIQKFIFTALTCALYYIPLVSIPFVTGRDAKGAYIAYAFAGSAILKMQDFMIKMRVANAANSGNGNFSLYYVVCIVAIVIQAVVMLLMEPWYIVFCLPMIMLIATIGFVKNVAWN